MQYEDSKLLRDGLSPIPFVVAELIVCSSVSA